MERPRLLAFPLHGTGAPFEVVPDQAGGSVGAQLLLELRATSFGPQSFPLIAGFFGATCASFADAFPALKVGVSDGMKGRT